MQFTLSPELGGMGWQPTDFNNTDINLVRLVYEEAVKRSKEQSNRIKKGGKGRRSSSEEVAVVNIETKNPTNLKFDWEK